MKREREADADHGPEGTDAGEPEPEPEGEAKEEIYDTTPVKTSGLERAMLSSGDLHLLKAPSIIKHQAMIKARSRQRHRLLVISGTAVQPYRYSSAVHARGGRG